MRRLNLGNAVILIFGQSLKGSDMSKLTMTSLLLLLSACTTAVTGRNDPPKVNFTSSMSLDDALGCVVAYMSKANTFGYPFRGVIIQPNQTYEVHPTREIMLGGEPIFVVVNRGTRTTSIQGYSLQRFQGVFDELETACSGRQ